MPTPGKMSALLVTYVLSYSRCLSRRTMVGGNGAVIVDDDSLAIVGFSSFWGAVCLFRKIVVFG